MSQANIIINHMNRKGSITSLEAFDRYGITRLAARIHDLRARGIDIRTVRIDHINRYGEHCQYAKYVLKEGAAKD